MGYDRLQFAVSALLLVAVLFPAVLVAIPPTPSFRPAALGVAFLLASAFAVALLRRANSHRDVVAFFLVGCGVLLLASAFVAPGGSTADLPAISTAAGRTWVVVGFAVAYWFAFRGGARGLLDRLTA